MGYSIFYRAEIANVGGMHRSHLRSLSGLDICPFDKINQFI